jgi:hypothetical protein
MRSVIDRRGRKMAKIDGQGYISRKSMGVRSKTGRENSVWRNWWLVKFLGKRDYGVVHVGKIYFPKEYVGKKVRFKIELDE